jgi:hypothetical protein
LPLVPPHELNVTYSCTNASCVWFTECSAIFGFVTAPSDSIGVVIQSTQFAFNGGPFPAGGGSALFDPTAGRSLLLEGSGLFAPNGITSASLRDEGVHP